MPLRSLLRVLTLLLGIFYLDTVCQTDAEDARAYYARGIQEYVAGPAKILVAAPVAQSKAPAGDYRRSGTRRQWAHQRPQRQVWEASAVPVLARRWLRWRVIRV
ncbi:hypothetical protein [Hymenobacter sp. PAMC 26628]|uniref:hypothetical protein n=1 Tax=Hymenobacter sp. PAMC 26628 TaxID=1484118 RepID=UPI000AA2EEF0|nr:hypothetical protein [Hymenobacter sp. PAMC 26628]